MLMSMSLGHVHFNIFKGQVKPEKFPWQLGQCSFILGQDIVKYFFSNALQWQNIIQVTIKENLVKRFMEFSRDR